MTASVGLEIGTSGRGGFPSAGVQSSGFQSSRSRLGELPGAFAIEARARDATPASPLQGRTAAGTPGASRAAAGAESFQARWQAMLASFAAGNGREDEEEPQDASAIRAAEAGTEAGSVAGAVRSSVVGADGTETKTAVEAQPDGTSGARNALSAGKSSATAQNPALTAAERQETSDAKPRATETAGISSRQGNAEAAHRRPKPTSAPAMAAGSVALAAQAGSMPVVIAAPAIAGSASEPAAATGDNQQRGWTLKAFQPGFSEASLSGVFAQQPGGGHRASQAASQSGMTVASTRAKPETVAHTAVQDERGDDASAPDAPGEAARAGSGPVLSAQQPSGVASDGSAVPGTTENKEGRQPGIPAPTGRPAASPLDPALPLQPSSADTDPALAPALAAAASRPSKGQAASVPSRTTRETGSAAAHAASASFPGAADGSLLARDPAAGSGGAHALNQAPAAAGGTLPGSRETFAALDAGPAAGTPNWIHAGTQQAEAGFQDPALGWVGVRADLGAGGIHATIVPGSVEAAQLLGGHLAGLDAHLAAEHIPVDSLRMANAEGSGNQSADYGGRPTGQQGTGQQGQPPEQGTTSLNSMGTQSQGRSGFESGARASQADQAEHTPAEQILPGSARHISVVA